MGGPHDLGPPRRAGHLARRAAGRLIVARVDITKATWIGPPDHFLHNEDGSRVALIPGETVCVIGAGEAAQSDHWQSETRRITKADLADELQTLGLPVDGTRDDLEARLAAHHEAADTPDSNDGGQGDNNDGSGGAGE